MSTFDKLVQKWCASLKCSTDFDSWGQLVEASDEYKRFVDHTLILLKNINTSIETVDCSESKKKILLKIAACLEIRSANLNSVNSSEDIKLEDLRKLISGAIVSEMNLFVPLLAILTIPFYSRHLKSSTSNTTSRNEDMADKESCFPVLTLDLTDHSLLPKLKATTGQNLIMVRLQKIGLKDATELIDPYFTISCKDATAVDLCQRQNTPVASGRVENYLTFGFDIHIQVPFENMPKGSAIFFELFHYKQKRRATSLKCFSFMELDELKAGPCVIELYKKPTDFRKKKLNLLTAKPLYLHLVLTISKE
uniref:C2 Aida-type domain-containing protein n=1 Tax=Ciona savignyi TaxID=51511 RepID=H2YCD6_CIOSA